MSSAENDKSIGFSRHIETLERKINEQSDQMDRWDEVLRKLNVDKDSIIRASSDAKVQEIKEKIWRWFQWRFWIISVFLAIIAVLGPSLILRALTSEIIVGKASELSGQVTEIVAKQNQEFQNAKDVLKFYKEERETFQKLSEWWKLSILQEDGESDYKDELYRFNLNFLRTPELLSDWVHRLRQEELHERHFLYLQLKTAQNFRSFNEIDFFTIDQVKSHSGYSSALEIENFLNRLDYKVIGTILRTDDRPRYQNRLETMERIIERLAGLGFHGVTFLISQPTWDNALTEISREHEIDIYLTSETCPRACIFSNRKTSGHIDEIRRIAADELKDKGILDEESQFDEIQYHSEELISEEKYLTVRDYAKAFPAIKKLERNNIILLVF